MTAANTLPRALLFALALGAASPAARALAGDESAVTLRRALSFLLARQVQEPLDIFIGDERVRDYPGDWPQFFSLRGTPALRVREVSPFMVAFIHHSLTHVVEENRESLGLSRRDVRGGD